MHTYPGDVPLPPVDGPPPARVPPLPRARVLVWDLPTRLLHWLLAGSFAGAFAIATLVRHRAPAFPLHMLLGVIAALAVAMRVVWGLVGSKYARLRSFAFGPRALLGYLRALVVGGGENHVGHNPANAWAAFGMLVGIVGAAVTGALMTTGVRAARPLHEALAYATLGLVVLHLVGIALHSLRRRENVVFAMLDGKQMAAQTQAIRSSHPVAAVVVLVLVGATAAELFHCYDRDSRTVAIPGLGTLRLGPGGRTADAGSRASRGRRRARAEGGSRLHDGPSSAEE
jgi:cytochrome b